MILVTCSPLSSLRSERDGLGQAEHSGRSSFGARVLVGRCTGADHAAEKDGGGERLHLLPLLEQRWKLPGHRDKRLQSGGKK